ncbi:Uncharacterized protein TCM_040047 [Theobroma cacao]|uniref:Integrase catalytic domain-containing protein n=1 Tax=Theobroma cacao TaxID=3641 RepID=A0A061GSC6_THECC|nr:Uncharacterized protein TCM_040047 [Theobroma cacao]
MCQLCEKPGHTAKICRLNKSSIKEPVANIATASQFHDNKNWVVYSRASHHVTADLNNLSLYTEYGGLEKIAVGGGTSLSINHIGFSIISTTNKPLKLTNVLHVPVMNRNLISISKFCKTNNVFVEFFPFHFLVKDSSMGAPLVRSLNRNGLYELPRCMSHLSMITTTFLSVKTSFDVWHRRLGHPSSEILTFMLKFFGLPSIASNKAFSCNSCACNESHKLPFGQSTLSSTKHLQLLYTDVWGPAQISFVEGFRYYVIYIDHFTKYIWFFLMKHNSDVYLLLPIFKALVKKAFNTSITCIYSDNGGKYQKMSKYLATHGISHLTTPPYTLELNGAAERRHKHIVETGLTLLHHASMPLKFWSHAFQVAVYPINKLPTPLLNLKSPFEILFETPPNYSKLKVFGCLCYPWLKPYNKHKLQPKSKPCVFLRYSINQSAYKCFDHESQRIFVSRHVMFQEHIFPFTSAKTQTTSRQAMIEEFNALVKNQTWVLVPPSSKQTVIGCKWVFKIKRKPDGSIDRYKARLVAKGFHQREGIDYTDTLIPVIKPTTIKIVLSIALSYGWPIQLSRPKFRAMTGVCLYTTKEYSTSSGGTRTNVQLVNAETPTKRWIQVYKDTSDIAYTSLYESIKVKVSHQQLDVNNAFLQGTLSEEVYMAQPTGFLDKDKPFHVCKLHKAIYGLK